MTLLRAGLIIAALFATAPAYSADMPISISEETVCAVLQPCAVPASFSSGPFLAPPEVRDVPLARIQRICSGGLHAAAGGNSLLGCAQLAGGKCVVHVPSDIKRAVPTLYRMILQHELAHCRGWRHERY
jgi:hypothetical protein